MSRAPYWLPSARFGANMGDGSMVDSLTGVLTCPIGDVHMGVTAENVADQFNISREEQDELANQSHQRAQRAIEENRFDGQILPIEIKTRKGVTIFEQDEHVRFDCDIESMAKLRPAFNKEGSVTAGNASGINDGAAALVLVEKAKAEEKGLKPIAKLIGYTLAGVDPFGLTFSGSSPSSLDTDKACAAKASFASQISISSICKPVFFSNF